MGCVRLGESSPHHWGVSHGAPSPVAPAALCVTAHPLQARPLHGRQGSRFSYPLKRHGFVGEENLRPSRSQSIHRLVDWAVHWSGLLGALASVACWRRPVPAREELWCYAPGRLRFQRSSSPLCWRCASQASVGWLVGSSSSSFLWAGWLALLFRPFRLVGWFCPRAVAGPLVGKGRRPMGVPRPCCRTRPRPAACVARQGLGVGQGAAPAGWLVVLPPPSSRLVGCLVCLCAGHPAARGSAPTGGSAVLPPHSLSVSCARVSAGSDKQKCCSFWR